MKKILRNTLMFVLSFSTLFSMAGCNNQTTDVVQKSILVEKDGGYELKKSGTGLKFYTSDEGFDAFINDFYARHIRGNNEDSIGRVKQGAGRLFQRDYEAKFISFYDSTAEAGFGYDAMDNLSTHLSFININGSYFHTSTWTYSLLSRIYSTSSLHSASISLYMLFDIANVLMGLSTIEEKHSNAVYPAITSPLIIFERSATTFLYTGEIR